MNESIFAFDRVRTCDLRVNSALLLPTELQKHNMKIFYRSYWDLNPGLQIQSLQC